MKQKILISGINGLIGKKLAENLKNDFEVMGLVRDIQKAKKVFQILNCINGLPIKITCRV